MRRFKTYFSFIALIMCAIIIWSFRGGETKVKGDINGIAIYPGAVLKARMSSTGFPWVVVFLTDDDYRDVVQFYEKKLNLKSRKLEYGNKSMTIYQFDLETKKEKEWKNTKVNKFLKNYLMSGVEIIPFNNFYRKVYKKSTKIKIIIPAESVPQDLKNLIYSK